MTQNKERIFYYDFLRAIAIIGIVSCHVASNFLVNPAIMNTIGWNFAVVIDCFRDFSIPIFVMLTGALLLNKDYSLSNFVKKRFNRVFVPYLFWLCIFIIFSYLFISRNMTIHTIYNITLGHAGTIGVVLWFVWMILVVYIAIFIINKIIFAVKNKYNHSNSKFIKNFDSYFIKLLVLAFIIYLIIIKITGFNPVPNRIIYYISFIGYACLGYYLSNLHITSTKLKEGLRITPTKLMICSLIIAICSYIYYIIQVINLSNISGHFASFSYFTFIILILSSSVFLSFRYFEESNKPSIKNIYSKIRYGILGKLINSLSKSSYGIYLVHFILMKYLYVLILFKIDYNNLNPIIALPILLIVVLVLSWIVIIILSKIPYLNRISGST